MRAELYPLYGGYSGYLAAPLHDVVEQRLRLAAKWSVEARKQAELEAEAATRQRELDSVRSYGSTR